MRNERLINVLSWIGSWMIGLVAALLLTWKVAGQPPIPPELDLTEDSIEEGYAWAHIAWDPSPDAGVASYRVHWGTNSGSYQSVTNAGQATDLWIPLLDAGTNYLVATAVGTNMLESDFSNELAIWMYETNGVLLERLTSTDQAEWMVEVSEVVDPVDPQRWWKLRATDLSDRGWRSVE